jgi:hypothetical protein
MSRKTPISEDIFQDALSTYRASKKPNIAAIARQFGISRHTLYGRIQGRRDRNSAAAPNRKLNPIQEKTLINWILSLNRAFLNPYPELIQDNANRLLGADQELGRNWVYRFIERLPPQFNYVTQKPKGKKRIEAEDIGPIGLWFDQYTELIKKYQFMSHEVFNWDETSFVLGQGKVSTTKRPQSDTGGEAENVTSIECISASGWLMTPWYLVKGIQHQELYDALDIDDYRIRTTPNGLTNNDVAIEWLCCFHEATKDLVAPDRPRLLLMDNHESHCTIDFMTFCDEHFIIPCYFIPHASHLIQPLDGQPYQNFKQNFEEENTEEVVWGESVATKRDFFRMIGSIRARSMTRQINESAFRSRGLFPVNSQLIIKPIIDKFSARTELDGFDNLHRDPALSPEPASPASSATNSPPDTPRRAQRLHDKLHQALENEPHLSAKTKRHIKRSSKATVLLAQRVQLLEQSLSQIKSVTDRANAAKIKK